ncbi:MAG: hypothetical protein QGI21_06060 [Candidatus Poseidoniaceae archaeon]|jgi:hypothetical protein|nr:hypothetical protein [Candidatus Poseidoniaceae archaeon]
MKGQLRKDEAAAATELGYMFTFLLGVILLSMFSWWAFDIETSTRERWNEQAIDANMADIAAAVERADQASRDGSDVHYAERVEWRPTEADESLFRLSLNSEMIELDHEEDLLDRQKPISGTNSGTYDGQISLSGLKYVWVIYEDGVTSLSTHRPNF